MKGIKIVILVIVMLGVKKVLSQQDPMFSQYNFNMQSVNPAYAGSLEMMSATAIHRSQWVGIDGAPNTQSISLSAPIKRKDIGIGVSFINDRIGPIKQFALNADFAYKIQINKKVNLALGIKGGIHNINVLLTQVNYVSQADLSFAQNLSGTMINFGFGAYLYDSKHKWSFGLSAPRLLEQQTGDEVVGFLQRRHYFLTGCYAFQLDRKFVLKPSFLARYVHSAPLSVDITVKGIYNDKFAIGGYYRVNESFGPMVELRINEQLRIGYAYEYNTTSLGRYTSGSHEVMLKYDFVYGKTNVVSPRIF